MTPFDDFAQIAPAEELYEPAQLDESVDDYLLNDIGLALRLQALGVKRSDA